MSESLRSFRSCHPLIGIEACASSHHRSREVASIPDPKAFRSVGTTQLGSDWCRTILFSRTITRACYGKIHGAGHKPWVTALLARRSTKVAAVALANLTSVPAAIITSDWRGEERGASQNAQHRCAAWPPASSRFSAAGDKEPFVGELAIYVGEKRVLAVACFTAGAVTSFRSGGAIVDSLRAIRALRWPTHPTEERKPLRAE
jgi:hypothetical protein